MHTQTRSVLLALLLVASAATVGLAAAPAAAHTSANDIGSLDDPTEAVEIDVDGEIEAGSDVTLTVTRDGSPVEEAPISINGEAVGETNADGELAATLPNETAEFELSLDVELESDGMRLVQHRVLGGPDDNHSVDVEPNRAGDLATSELSEDVDWTVDDVHLVEGAGVYDVRLNGDGTEQATVRVDGSSGDVVFLQEKHPQEASSDANVTVSDYEVSNTTVAVNETVTVTATAENSGDVNGSTTVTLVADGESVETRNVSVGSNASETVTLETSFADAGAHTVSVNDLEPTNVTVEGDAGPPSNETDARADRVDVVLDGAPDGLRTYHVTVTASEEANATIEGIESQLLSNEKVQIVERTNTSISFRAADLSDAAGPFNGSRVLATVQLSAPVTAEGVDLSIEQLSDDSGTSIAEDRLRLALQGVLFAEPLPGGAGAAAPTDPDGDGLFEDTDGDDDADFDDAIALAFVDYESLSSEQRAALDFNDDGGLTFADAIELAFQV